MYVYLRVQPRVLIRQRFPHGLQPRNRHPFGQRRLARAGDHIVVPLLRKSKQKKRINTRSSNRNSKE